MIGVCTKLSLAALVIRMEEEAKKVVERVEVGWCMVGKDFAGFVEDGRNTAIHKTCLLVIEQGRWHGYGEGLQCLEEGLPRLRILLDSR